MDQIMTDLFRQALAPAILLAAGAAAVWLVTNSVTAIADARRWLKEQKYGPEILQVFDIAVRATEQTGLAAAVKLTSQEKKAECVKFLMPLLASAGLKLSDQEVDALIEDAVFRNFNAYDMWEKAKAAAETPQATPEA